MTRKHKIAVRRETALSHFSDTDEFEEYQAMSDEQLLDNFIGAGFFGDESVVHTVIYKGTLPDDCIDAETVGDVTGWPCDIEHYY